MEVLVADMETELGAKLRVNTCAAGNLLACMKVAALIRETSRVEVEDFCRVGEMESGVDSGDSSTARPEGDVNRNDSKCGVEQKVKLLSFQSTNRL